MNPPFKIDRKFIILILMTPFLILLYYLGTEVGFRDTWVIAPISLIGVTLLTLYMLMRWADQANISLEKKKEQKIDNLLSKLTDRDLDLLRERLMNLEEDDDDEPLPGKQKRSADR